MKRRLSIALLMVYIISIMSSVFAASPIDPIEKPQSLLETFLATFYTDEYDLYTICGAGDSDLTETFYARTCEFYLEDNWDAIKAEYDAMGVTGIHKTRDIDLGIAPNSSDLAKSKEDSYYSKLACISGNGGHDIEIATVLRGTYYYDPNSMEVTQVSKPVITYKAISYGNGKEQLYDTTLTGSKAGKFGAAFSLSTYVRYTVTAENMSVITYKYGPYTHSFMGYVDD